jgi:pimeloyl-ACP methyl ester carboxylesterase
LIIAEQGSFAAGGSVLRKPGRYDPYNHTEDGQTISGDHAFVRYQLPVNARPLPLVFLHGYCQSSKTWETTPDGREGFNNIFLRRGFAVYLVDQPRRGEAGKTFTSYQIPVTADEQDNFNTWRLGLWPDFYPGVQFSREPEALNQYFRQITPNCGEFDIDVVAGSMASLFERIGGGILVSHSQGGGPGWFTAIKSDKVKAIVAYEPGSNMVFPKGEAPDPMPTCTPGNILTAVEIPLEDFMALTRIPIVLYYGDNIPEKPQDDPGKDNWRVRFDMAGLFVDKINSYGGDASLVHMTDLGIYGNTHFPFSDTNNLDVADLLSQYLREKKLD